VSKAQKARDIIKLYPYSSKKELGKLLYTENPILFSGPEDARKAIVGVTTKGGRKHRKIQSEDYKGPLSIPMGKKNDYSPYVLRGKMVGIISDLHIPYHDLTSIKLTLKYLKGVGIDTLILNGDIIDCYQLSRWEKDPENKKFKEEIEMLNQFLDDLQKYFPKVQIIYKLGNHEERYEIFIMQKAPELWKLEVLSWESLIRSKEREIDVVKNKRMIQAGKLNIIHGHEFGHSFFNPVNPARGLYLRAKANVIAGHSHQTSEHVEADMNGKINGAWSTGALCDLHPAYAPLNKWCTGFAHVEIDGQQFEVHNHKIIDGKIK
jgi:predicted phosphodiesterase